MKLVKYDKFLETTLNIPLLKTVRNGKQRGDILVKKLEEPKPRLTLDNGDKVDIDPDNAEKVSNAITNTSGEYDDTEGMKTFISDKNRYLDVLKDKEGKPYKLNSFRKDTDFGSSGAGVNTRNYENLQCIYLAHKLVRPDVDLTGVNIVRLLEEYNDSGSEIANRIHLHLPNVTKVDDILMDALDSPDWTTTLVEVTKDLYDFESRSLRLFSKRFTGKYHVYHISCKEKTSPFNLIRNKFNSILKSLDLESKLKIEFSKYCPADVIVSVDDFNISELLDEVKSIDGIKDKDGNIIEPGLTDVINSLYSNRILIPISLKKVGVTVNSIKTYNIIINNEFERPLPEFQIESFVIYEDIERGIGSKIKLNSSWRDAKDKEIDGEDRTLTIDSANTSKRLNVDGEVEGKFSRHGKISFLYMKYFIDSTKEITGLDNLQILEEYSELEKLNEETLINKIQSILIKMNDISNENSKLIKITYPKKTGTKISTGRPIGNDNRKSKLISKLQSLQIILAVTEVRLFDHNVADDLMNKIMRYALSIQADVFVTPRYVRVI
jgi:hypothetical protein